MCHLNYVGERSWNVVATVTTVLASNFLFFFLFRNQPFSLILVLVKRDGDV